MADVLPLPIPMLARPLDMVCGPPDPADRMMPMHRERYGVAVWLTPGGRLDGPAVINPGEPGQPEPLPWKRPRRP